MSRGVAPHAYRPTEVSAYPNGACIGTGMAISGAAANPNMGYHTSPAVSFLMTIFNVRLGWWLGNPRHKRSYADSSPRNGLLYLLDELRGEAGDKGEFINLSDGGHFENLGIYELVRRRCKYIFACDGEQDGNLTFSGLGNAIRKCRVDLGVEIDIVLDRILRDPEKSELGAAHCVVGDITHPDGFKARLIYLKASLSGDEPADVREYKARAKQFPHQSTADQWFDESQFESYRRLGYHLVERALKPAAEGLDLGTDAGFDDFVNRLADLWAVPQTPPEVSVRVAAAAAGIATVTGN
jgi:hypothetical protein